MEERRLNEKESLELITRMMQNTKMNLEIGSGNSLRGVLKLSYTNNPRYLL
ncbi:MAG: hypothetical protein R3Y26_11995 [Rikenellaceae bacterium]